MHEILFRGKRVDNGKWVEGYYSNLGGNSPRILKENIFIGKRGRVLEFENIKVLYKTVGQYTGLTDKNGVKIFEGDIVDILTENEEIGVITYDEGGFVVKADGFCVDFHNNINGTDLEVIGSIHDNPELLKDQL